MLGWLDAWLKQLQKPNQPVQSGAPPFVKQGLGVFFQYAAGAV